MRMPVRGVLFPTDFSTASQAAWAKAVEIASQNQARLVVAHVMSPPILFTASPSRYAGPKVPLGPKVYQELHASVRTEANRQLGALVAAAKKAGVKTTGVLTKGTLHEQIIRIAKREQVNLIVMGTHGRTGFSKVFLGSVATRVVQHAPCPVLTVRG